MDFMKVAIFLHLLDQLIDLSLHRGLATLATFATLLGVILVLVLHYRASISSHLPFNELCIDTSLVEKLLMATELENLALMHDSDLLGVDHSAQAVRDEDYGAPCLVDKRLDGLLYNGLVLSI